MERENLITIVVHTRQRASKLKEVLEANGIEVTLENLELNSDKILPGYQKVKIKSESLPLAVKILESGDLVSAPLSIPRIDNLGNTLLIPVDLSPSSILAVKVGFYLAKKLDLEPLILHAFLAPQFSPSEYYENQVDPVEMPDLSTIEEEIDLKNSASSSLSKFKRLVEKYIKDGKIDDIKFSTILLEGVAEQVIDEYCRQNKPMMVVLTTRNVAQKGTDLIGSVTAEVVDNCRVPVLTVPSNYVPRGVESIRKIAMFCTFTNFDAINVRGLMRMFNYPSCEIWLIPTNDNHISGVDAKLEKLNKYLSESYPTASFHNFTIGKGKFDEAIKQFIDQHDIEMIFVPNKKSNAISRFFKPTLAHKMLFERDIPLLVLPV